jgi:hypothetical protein
MCDKKIPRNNKYVECKICNITIKLISLNAHLDTNKHKECVMVSKRTSRKWDAGL